MQEGFGEMTKDDYERRSEINNKRDSVLIDMGATAKPIFEYKDHEFCDSEGCSWLSFVGGANKCSCLSCVLTAKQFHKWLKSNGYRIVKEGE